MEKVAPFGMIPHLYLTIMVRKRRILTQYRTLNYFVLITQENKKTVSFIISYFVLYSFILIPPNFLFTDDEPPKNITTTDLPKKKSLVKDKKTTTTNKKTTRSKHKTVPTKVITRTSKRLQNQRKKK